MEQLTEYMYVVEYTQVCGKVVDVRVEQLPHPLHYSISPVHRVCF